MVKSLEERIIEREKVRVREGDVIAVLYDNGQSIIYFDKPNEGGPLGNVGHLSLDFRTGEWGCGLVTGGHLLSFKPIDNAHLGFWLQVEDATRKLFEMLEKAGELIPKKPIHCPEAQNLVSLAISYGKTSIHPLERPLEFLARFIYQNTLARTGLDPDWYFKPKREFKALFKKGFLKRYDFSPEVLKDGPRRIKKIDFQNESLVAMVHKHLGYKDRSRIDIFSPKAYYSASSDPYGQHLGCKGEHGSHSCENTHFFDKENSNVIVINFDDEEISPNFMEIFHLKHVLKLDKTAYPEMDYCGLITKNDPRLFLKIEEEELEPIIKVLPFPYFRRDVKKLYRETKQGITKK